MNKILLLSLSLSLCLWLSPVYADDDAVGAPGWKDYSGEPGDAQTAPKNAEALLEQMRINYMSEAKVRVYELGQPGEELEGFNVFIDTVLVGQTPLKLGAFLVTKNGYELSVEKPGWEEAVRPNLGIPQEGEISVAVIKNNPAGWYTTPAFVLGTAALVGSLVAYAQPDGENLGLGLLGGGVGIIAITQLLARFVHIPVSKKNVLARNRSHLKKQ